MAGRHMSKRLRKKRLELIRQRHQALILQPREALADEYDGEFEDPFDEFDDADRLELVEAAGSSDM
jgi:hypothetical protein